MRKLFFILILGGLFFGCGDSGSDDAPGPDPAPAPTPNPGDDDDDEPDEWSWNMAADSLTYAYVDRFLNKQKGIFWGSANNVLDNTRYLYWQQAHAIDVLVYSYERIKGSNPTLANQYKNYFKLWFDNKANNWYDWRGAGDPTGFLNEYTDDMCWIILTMLHMSEATGDLTYFDMGRKLYDDYVVARAWEDEKGWGFPWKSNDRNRNACTNTPGCIIACKLFSATGEQKYFDHAEKLYNLMLNNGTVRSTGAVGEPPLTYTQGTWIEACRLLYHITKVKAYMDQAELAANFTMTGGRCTTNGILRNERAGNDDENNTVFKAVLVPYLVNLAKDSSAQLSTRNAVKKFLKTNAEALWFKNVDRTLYPAMYCNHYWGTMYSDAGMPGSLGSQASGAQLIEGMTRLGL